MPQRRYQLLDTAPLSDVVRVSAPRGIDAQAADYSWAARPVRMDTDMVRVQGSLMAGLGEGIERFGAEMGKLQERAALAKEIRAEAEAENRMTAWQGKLAERLAKENDEEKWADLTESTLGEAEQEIFSGDLAEVSPAAAEAIRLKHSRWATHLRSKSRVSAAEMSVRKAESAIHDKLNYAAEDGDLPGHEAVLDAAEKGGWISPERGMVLRQKAIQTAKGKVKESSENALAGMVDTNPWQLLENLEKNTKDGQNPDFPGFDAVDLLNAKQKAKASMHSKQREVVESLTAGIVSGTVNDEGIDEFAASVRLPADQVAALKADRAKLAAAQAKLGPWRAEEFQKLGQKMKEYNAAADPDGTKGHALLRESYLLETTSDEAGERMAAAQREPFLEKLRRSKSDRVDADVKQTLVALMHDYFQADEEAGIFGDLTKDDKAEAKDPARKKARLEAIRRSAEARADARMALESALRKNPDMGVEEFQTWYTRMTGRKRAVPVAERYAPIDPGNTGATADLLPPVKQTNPGGPERLPSPQDWKMSPEELDKKLKEILKPKP